MGKINNMQENQNHMIRYLKDEERREKQKPRLKVKNIKDIATLIGPTAKKYHLTPNQKNFQLKGRLTIAAIATAFAIGGGIAVNNQIQNSKIDQNATTISVDSNYELLDKETVLANATNKLQESIYPSPSLYNDIKVEYGKDDELGYHSITFKHQSKYSFDYFEEYKYFKTNNKGNSDIINQIFNKILEIKNSKNPSQEELQELENLIDEFDPKSFHLEGGNLVQNTEKELGEER